MSLRYPLGSRIWAVVCKSIVIPRLGCLPASHRCSLPLHDVLLYASLCSSTTFLFRRLFLLISTSTLLPPTPPPHAARILPPYDQSCVSGKPFAALPPALLHQRRSRIHSLNSHYVLLPNECHPQLLALQFRVKIVQMVAPNAAARTSDRIPPQKCKNNPQIQTLSVL